MKQTAVEWLHYVSKQRELDKFDWEQAKEMEKKQITDAYTIGRYQQRIDEFVEINDIVLKYLKKD